MKKTIVLALSLVLIASSFLCAPWVNALIPLDPDASASLTLSYQKEGTPFADLTVGIYRVAGAFADGSFELIPPFSSFPVSIYDITAQEQWKNLADTLYSYIVSRRIAPDAQAVTDGQGRAVFEALPTGLYLVEELVADNSAGTYRFNRFMVYLPMPQEDGSYLYNVQANPKCTAFVPKTQYRVTKLWQDAGFQNDRPEEVVIDIYKDGVWQESQTLSAQTNWSYLWYVSQDDPGIWTVAERWADPLYKVTVWQNGSSFSIINTHVIHQEMPDNPSTGDGANPMFYVVTLCVSGILLILFVLYSGRRKGE